MKELDLNDFDNFYIQQLEPKLIKLEEERKKVWFNYIKSIVFFISSIVLSLSIPIFFCFLCEHKYVNGNIFILTLIVFLASPICIIFTLFKFNDMENKKEQNIKNLKAKVYAIIFGYFNLEYKRLAAKNSRTYKTLITKLFDKNNENEYMHFEIKLDDCIKGEYKDIPFELVDAELYEREFLNCLFLAVKINKNFYKETVIKSNNFKLFNINKEEVKLEDIEFPKHFKVYTDDQIEARYLLTPSFMERLKNYHKSKQDKTIIFFDSKVSSVSNMFILTNTGKDNFEIPFNKSILNKEYYYNLIQELINMLEIASTLKLEQNIGL